MEKKLPEKKPWFNAKAYHEQRDSLKITEKIIFEALKKGPKLDISHVRVLVKGSVVTLEGTIEDPNEARAMEKIVKKVSGVSEVINHLSGTRGIEL